MAEREDQAVQVVEWEIRGIPLWLIQEYLVEMGGRATQPDLIEGPGWEASLQQMADYQIGSISIGQVRLTLKAKPETMEVIRPELEKKLIRGGG